MINFRYHIVSITAVFLAVGIGVALGSTFLDGPTVDLLNRNIRSAEGRIAATEAENDRLAEENELAEARDLSLLTDAGERLVGTYLADQPVLVVVGPGVENAVANGLRQVLGATAADLRGTLVLSDQMALDGELDEDLADALDIDAVSSRTLWVSVHEQLSAALVAAGAPSEELGPDGEAPPDGDLPPADEGENGAEGPPDGEALPEGPTGTDGDDDPDGPPDGQDETDPDADTTTTAPDGFGADESDDPESDDPESDDGEPVEGEPDGTQPDIISILADRDYLAIEPGPEVEPASPILETTGYRYVFVTDEGISGPEAEAMARLLPSGSPDGALPVVFVSPAAAEPDDDEEPPTPSLVELIREDEELRGLYGTVDDIDAFSGLVATVLVLDDLEDAPPGHYGQGDGAQGVLPPAP